MTSAPNDAEIIEIFPTPIMTVRWSQAERRNPELIQAIFAKEKAHPGVNRSNKGGWHSKGDLPQWAGEAGRELLNFAVEVANTATERVMMGEPLAPHQWKVIMWANVNRAGQFNAVHVHPRSTWSGCSA